MYVYLCARRFLFLGGGILDLVQPGGAIFNGEGASFNFRNKANAVFINTAAVRETNTINSYCYSNYILVTLRL